MVRSLTARRTVHLLLFLVFSASSMLFGIALAGRKGNFFDDGRRPIATDFVVFYAAGRVVANGEGSRLYDPNLQRTEQIQGLGRAPESYIPFPYPAWVAVPYAVLAQVPYLPAFLVAMTGAFLLLVPSVRLLGRVSPTVRDAPFLVGLGLAAFWPLFWGLTNGQATSFWLLCLVGSYVALSQRRDTVAGVWLGLLLGKPQLAVFLFPLVVWRRRWRTLGSAIAVGTLLCLAGVAIAGVTWPWSFLALVTGREYNLAEVNRAGILHMSLNGVAANLLGLTDRLTAVIAILLTLAVAIGVALAWRRGGSTDATFPLQFGLAVAATLAVSPHALFYDAPFLVLPGLALVDRWRVDAAPGGEVFTQRRRLLLVGLFMSGFVWRFVLVTTVQPLAVLPVAVGVAVAWELMRRRTATAADGDVLLPGEGSPETSLLKAA